MSANDIASQLTTIAKKNPILAFVISLVLILVLIFSIVALIWPSLSGLNFGQTKQLSDEEKTIIYILDENGMPITNADVSLISEAGVTVPTKKTDVSGRAFFDLPDPYINKTTTITVIPNRVGSLPIQIEYEVFKEKSSTRTVYVKPTKP